MKTARNKTIPDPRRGVSVIQSHGPSPRAEEQHISAEDQREAEELKNDIQAEFPDVFR